MIEYKLLFKQDTFQAAKRTFTELNITILTEKENWFSILTQPFFIIYFYKGLFMCVHDFLAFHKWHAFLRL